jgi:glycosyltransferase involved in cell wall biosynthesis
MKEEARPDGKAPRVSVVMGIAREEPYLPAAIESILNQSFQDFEFLIVLDEAVSYLGDKILGLYSGDGRIKILRAPSLGGLAYALNMGIGQARGEYIARMDGDDLSWPDRLLEQVRHMDENKDVGVLGCRVLLIDANSEEIRREIPYYQTDAEIRRILPFRNPMVHPALMFRKSAMYAVRGYKYGNSAEDYEMFIRMARNPHVKFHNLDKRLFAYRRHDQQGTGLHRVKSNHWDKAGFLFTEFLRTKSLKYIGGIIVTHPLIYRIRMLFRKWFRGSNH